MIIKRFKTTKYVKQDKIIVECEICKKQRIITWRKRNDKETHLCKKCEKRLRFGKESRIQNGYRFIYAELHPRVKTGRQPFVQEHILVMEQYLGRFLGLQDIVHHIDKNKLNNKIENLFLCSGATQSDVYRIHQNCHQSAKNLGLFLYSMGLVKFRNGEYQMSEIFENLIKVFKNDN